jgi:hypothetical protein
LPNNSNLKEQTDRSERLLVIRILGAIDVGGHDEEDVESLSFVRLEGWRVWERECRVELQGYM